MSRYLCTFPGKFGDILWSLPTAKYIAEKVVSTPVDFAVMSYYESLIPLLQEQTYIDRAFVIRDWLRTHSNYGDQPWEAPTGFQWDNEPNYERVWHLGYRCHPGTPFGNPDMALMDFIAYQQGITFNEPVIPFITAEKRVSEHCVAYCFNEQYAEMKNEFVKVFTDDMHSNSILAVKLDEVPWHVAAGIMASECCVAFVGDRSASWVIANGLGKLCITYEPHPSRHKSGPLGKVFGCPGGKEFALPFGLPAKVAGQIAATMVKKKIEERTMTAHG